MSTVKKVTDSIIYVGVNDHKIDLFEGQYDVRISTSPMNGWTTWQRP